MKKRLFLIGLLVFSFLTGCASDGKLQKENDIDNTGNRMDVSEGALEREALNKEEDTQDMTHIDMQNRKSVSKTDWQSAYMEYLTNGDPLSRFSTS